MLLKDLDVSFGSIRIIIFPWFKRSMSGGFSNERIFDTNDNIHDVYLSTKKRIVTHVNHGYVL